MPSQNPEDRNSLYNRIGGEKIVVAVVDRMYDKILQDPSLKPFFEGVDMDHIRRNRTNLIVSTFDRSYLYESEGLKQERDDKIRSFDALTPHLKEALTELQISSSLIAEALNLV